MYKNILVPLDGSPRAEAILPHIEKLFAGSEVKITLLNVFEPNFNLIDSYGHPPEFYDALSDKWLNEATTYLQGVTARLKEHGLRVRFFVETGPVVGTILKVAERENASLIAMASHGRSALGSIFYGSVAAGVLHRVDRPLLLVRSGAD
jgi:nucleotide-binding universal stress UspA family protein